MSKFIENSNIEFSQFSTVSKETKLLENSSLNSYDLFIASSLLPLSSNRNYSVTKHFISVPFQHFASMGIKQDTEDSLKDFEFTKIDGQPSDEDISTLIKELTNAASSISTTNGGGQHGYIGMIIPDAQYTLFSHNAEPFQVITNPGPYPATVDPDILIRERQIAEHKAEIAEFQTYQGVENFLRKAIVKAIDPEWLAEIEDENVGFNHLSPQQLLDHLRIVGGSLDHVDVTELIQALQKPWDHVEAPATMFARGDKIERQLIKAGQPANPELRLAFALSTFEASGEFEAPLREWKARPLVDRTFAKFRVFLQKEYANRNKHNKATAQSTGRGIANALTDATMDKVDEAEAAAMAVAEIAQALQAQQNEQMKQMMEMFKTFMQAKPANAPAPTPAPPAAPKPRKVCPHCKRPHSKPELCWELEANAANRPANWKPVAERNQKQNS